MYSGRMKIALRKFVNCPKTQSLSYVGSASLFGVYAKSHTMLKVQSPTASLEALFPRCPPNTHIGCNDQIQHFQPVIVDDELPQLRPLAAVAATGTLPA